MEIKDWKCLEVGRRYPRELEYGNLKSANHFKAYEGRFGKVSAVERAKLSSLEEKEAFRRMF